MKKLFLALIFRVGVLALCSCTKEAQATAFPDANFRAELVKLGFVNTNGDIDPNNPTNKTLFASSVELSLTLTAKQDANRDTHIHIGVYDIYNARITKIIK